LANVSIFFVFELYYFKLNLK